MNNGSAVTPVRRAEQPTSVRTLVDDTHYPGDQQTNPTATFSSQAGFWTGQINGQFSWVGTRFIIPRLIVMY